MFEKIDWSKMQQYVYDVRCTDCGKEWTVAKMLFSPPDEYNKRTQCMACSRREISKDIHQVYPMATKEIWAAAYEVAKANMDVEENETDNAR